MNGGGPLLVPMTVEAFVVNDHVREGGPFVRSQMRYDQLAEGGDAQPGLDDRDLAFGRAEAVHGVSASDYYNGVYLKWRLPAAFTQGVQDSAAGQLRFPLIPNRWIVVRYGGPLDARRASAWVIESDYQWTGPQPARNASQVGTLYVRQADGQPPAAFYMGRNVDLDGGAWTEPGTSQELTALAPGNTAFAFYQPQNNNVLSFVDVLGEGAAETLSYQVFGWFSLPADDPLAAVGPDGFKATMEALGWSLPEGTDPGLSASWSLLSGYVTGVKWQTAQKPPGGAPLDEPLTVAVGNTSVEALTAMVAAQAAGAKVEVDVELLEAFQLGMLDTLDEPDGAAKLAEKLHASFFQRFGGGYCWDVVDAPGAEPAGEAELAREAAWLAQLNRDQASLDAAIRGLAVAQLELYELWWKRFCWRASYRTTVVKGPGGGPLTQEDLRQQLLPTVAGSAAAQAAAKLQETVEAAAKVPSGATQEELSGAVAAYAAARGLPASRQLKRSAAATYYAPNNPVVLLAGAGASGIVPPAAATVCRFASQLLHGFEWQSGKVTASTPNLAIPAPALGNASGVPWSAALATALVEEAFFLDPASATAIAAALPGSTVAGVEAAMASAPLGTLPAGAVTAWAENPWHPLLLLWQLTYYPLAYGTPEAPNWTFADGAYSWNGTGAGEPLGLGGTIQLGAAASFNMAAQVQRFLATEPSLEPQELAELKALLAFVETQENDWDLLSQALDGFNEQLQLRASGAFAGPECTDVVTVPPLSTLVGDQAGRPPTPGPLPANRVPPSQFQPWRAGQLAFAELIVIDEWGQALWPIDANNAGTEIVYAPPDLIPAHPVLHDATETLVQLPPAIVQPARLAFEPLSAADDSVVAGPSDPEADPICGWLLPNHLDASLVAYDATGAALGEISVGVGVSGGARPCWSPAPEGPCETLAEVAREVPHLGPFLATLAAEEASAFAALLAAIDETAWTTVPAGAAFDSSLAALVGRPLAMVRAAVGFELEGAAPDPSWQFTFDPQPPALSGYELDVQLGALHRLDDGLVGYFLEDDYTTLNVVAEAGAAPSPYLQTIGADGDFLRLPCDGRTRAHLSLLVDPRAPVRATTAVLPDTTLALPPGRVEEALAAIAVSFRLDGVLTDSETAAPAETGGSPETTILVPLPAVPRGTWTWVEEDAGGWSRLPTGAPDATAKLGAVPPTLRRGLLQLSDFEQPTAPEKEPP